MGLMLSAQCPCGIEAQLFVGSGMSGGPPRVVAWCKPCEHLTTVSKQARRPRCKKCRGPLRALEPFESAGRAEESPETPVRCPRCGNLNLRFAAVGLWD